MGACVSFSHSPPASSSTAEASQRTPTAKVVNLDGSMAQLPGPVVTALEALGHGHRASSSSPRRVILCSSDELGYDAPPRAMAAGEALQTGQLYFVLPASALRRPMSPKDMAALAVRAATALAAEAGLAAAGGLSPPRRRGKQAGGGTTTPGKPRRRRGSTARVAPLLLAAVSEESRQQPDDGGVRNNDVPGGYAVVQDGDGMVKKARKSAGYGAGRSRHGAVVKRLSAIAEDGE